MFHTPPVLFLLFLNIIQGLSLYSTSEMRSSERRPILQQKKGPPYSLNPRLLFDIFSFVFFSRRPPSSKLFMFYIFLSNTHKIQVIWVFWCSPWFKKRTYQRRHGVGLKWLFPLWTSPSFCTRVFFWSSVCQFTKIRYWSHFLVHHTYDPPPESGIRWANDGFCNRREEGWKLRFCERFVIFGAVFDPKKVIGRKNNKGLFTD